MFLLLSKLNLPIELTRHISEYLIYPIHKCALLIKNDLKAIKGFDIKNVRFDGFNQLRYRSQRTMRSIHANGQTKIMWYYNQLRQWNYFNKREIQRCENDKCLRLLYPEYVICDCHSVVLVQSLKRHLKSNKHLMYIKKLEFVEYYDYST